jgi:hypothetical protein
MRNVKVVDVYLERIDENSPAKLRPERRQSVKDRRTLHTYIADDRRSGLADRRKGPMTRSGGGNKKS